MEVESFYFHSHVCSSWPIERKNADHFFSPRSMCSVFIPFINIIISSFVFIPTDENSSFGNCHFFFAPFSLFLFGIEFCRSLLLIENLNFFFILQKACTYVTLMGLLRNID